MIRRAWVWAFGPRGDGFALLCAIAADYLAVLTAIAIGCAAVVALATWVFG
jgi:hypothetical protein